MTKIVYMVGKYMHLLIYNKKYIDDSNVTGRHNNYQVYTRYSSYVKYIYLLQTIMAVYVKLTWDAMWVKFICSCKFSSDTFWFLSHMI